MEVFMRKIFTIFLVLFLAVPVFGQTQPAKAEKADNGVKKPVVYFFYSPHCGACMKLDKEFLPDIFKQYENKIQWERINVMEAKGMSMLIRLVELYKKPRPATPTMLVGEVLLMGSTDIKTNLVNNIEDILAGRRQHYSGITADPGALSTLMSFFKKVTFGTVLVTGLVDGVNPCAFAVIAFFVSFLSVYGYKKREIFFVGCGYCLAVFITYILIGLGLFEAMYRFSGFYQIKKIFYYMISAFCFCLFALAVYDYRRFKQSGSTDDMVLQLPKFLKKNIHVVIGKNLRDKGDRTVWGLFFTSLIVGFCVAILEGACTGQLYLPAIALIAQNAGVRIKALGYLFLYNVMFILPLIFIFTLSLWGIGSDVFNQFLKRHIGRIKIAMAVVFLLMAVILLFLA